MNRTSVGALEVIRNHVIRDDYHGAGVKSWAETKPAIFGEPELQLNLIHMAIAIFGEQDWIRMDPYLHPLSKSNSTNSNGGGGFA